MRLSALLLVLASTAAHADPRVELGLAAGGHAFSSNLELGVADDMAAPGPTSNAMIGARVAYPVAKRIAFEGEALVIPTKDDVLGKPATVYGVRAHVRFDLLTGRLRPFLVAGMGAHVLRSSSPQMSNDADKSFHWGGGVRWALNDRYDVRLDARHLIVPDRTLDGATSDFEVTAGITYRFGHSPRANRVEPRPVAAPGDRDGDGITDDVDQCPTKPEDRDGFEDDDGCPDPDNDKDGIVDTLDKCPLEPETNNGWKDEDGCPDQVIQELTGIAFEIDSAKIDDASGPLLEKAYQILKDNPGISVEISGHTSSEGNADRNLELSLRRAEAVKAYLVKRGIDAARILTVGHGSDVPRGDNRTDGGRRENRRIEFRILTNADVR